MKNDNEQTSRWSRTAERGFATPQDVAPQTFVDWWTGHDHCPQRCTSPDGRRGMSSGITAHKAWQMECYRLEFQDRKHTHASGTALNYAWYGRHRAEDIPPTSNPVLLEEHARWCIKHRKHDPRISTPMPEIMKFTKTFSDVKEVVRSLSEKMDMNKAIGWTDEDSQALEPS